MDRDPVRFVQRQHFVAERQKIQSLKRTIRSRNDDDARRNKIPHTHQQRACLRGIERVQRIHDQYQLRRWASQGAGVAELRLCFGHESAGKVQRSRIQGAERLGCSAMKQLSQRVAPVHLVK